MTTAIIITLCVLILIAYTFDLTSSKTKIPSVILLLLLGWVLQQLTRYLSIQLPDLTKALPVTSLSIPLVNRSLVIQVIVLTALVMMFGLMMNKEDKHIQA